MSMSESESLANRKQGDPGAVARWSTNDLRPGEAFDAWSEALSSTFLPWRPFEKSSGSFAAWIKCAASAGMSLIHCSCDTSRGFRRRSESAVRPMPGMPCSACCQVGK